MGVLLWSSQAMTKNKIPFVAIQVALKVPMFLRTRNIIYKINYFYPWWNVKILAFCASNPEAIVVYIESLESQIKELSEKLQVLEARLDQNSRNSGKPPSTGFSVKNKPKLIVMKLGWKLKVKDIGFIWFPMINMPVILLFKKEDPKQLRQWEFFLSLRSSSSRWMEILLQFISFVFG